MKTSNKLFKIILLMITMSAGASAYAHGGWGGGYHGGGWAHHGYVGHHGGYYGGYGNYYGRGWGYGAAGWGAAGLIALPAAAAYYSGYNNNCYWVARHYYHGHLVPAHKVCN